MWRYPDGQKPFRGLFEENDKHLAPDNAQGLVNSAVTAPDNAQMGQVSIATCSRSAVGKKPNRDDDDEIIVLAAKAQYLRRLVSCSCIPPVSCSVCRLSQRSPSRRSERSPIRRLEPNFEIRSVLPWLKPIGRAQSSEFEHAVLLGSNKIEIRMRSHRLETDRQHQKLLLHLRQFSNWQDFRQR